MEKTLWRSGSDIIIEEENGINLYSISIDLRTRQEDYNFICHLTKEEFRAIEVETWKATKDLLYLAALKGV